MYIMEWKNKTVFNLNGTIINLNINIYVYLQYFGLKSSKSSFCSSYIESSLLVCIRNPDISELYIDESWCNSKLCNKLHRIFVVSVNSQVISWALDTHNSVPKYFLVTYDIFNIFILVINFDIYHHMFSGTCQKMWTNFMVWLRRYQVAYTIPQQIFESNF